MASRRLVTATLPLLLALALAGCASAAGAGASAQPTGSAVASAGTSGAVTQSASPGTSTDAGAGTGGGSGSASAVPSASSVRTITLDEHSAGTTVAVAQGDTVVLVMHSSYWSAPVNSAPKLLQQMGGTAGSAAPPGPTCHPGQGCGTVTTTFVAKGAGTAKLSATRTSCGEAMACSPAQRSFSVTLVITGS
ncbi:hypothetical protein [Streptacidiphilus sp. EB129]|uniref:hypothetical protein n=1 Tax=Streptacidiphilus sp. EB129 TaxID=3156262 RepID=UPI0035173067